VGCGTRAAQMRRMGGIARGDRAAGGAPDRIKIGADFMDCMI
jgi:hypothetical protein